MKRATIGIVTLLGGIAILFAACGFDDDGNYRTTGYDESSFAIKNAEGENGMLRTGTSVNVALGAGLRLDPSTVYQVVVRNLSTGAELSRADLLTDPRGLLELTTVAHDLGEFDDVQEEHTLALSIEQDPTGKGRSMVMAEVELAVVPHMIQMQGHGIEIDELQPPHIYSAALDGSPANAFVVGAMPDPGELGAPIYVAGRDFPRGTTAVDIYIAKDRDRWQQSAFPQQGDEGWIAGPVLGQVVDGVLQPTAMPWQPKKADIGPYDVLIDVDRDGAFDYSVSEKDGADGENKVGMTIQLSAAWGRAMMDSQAARIAANAAQQAAEAADQAAQAAEAAGSAPEAVAKAQAARAAATKAQNQAQKAGEAATAAEGAFNRELADAAACRTQAEAADAAAKIAAEQAKLATAEEDNAAAAQAAWEKVMTSKLTAGHLLVNLAFASRERQGQWANAYDRRSTVYTYINPPLQKGEKHAKVAKVLVVHQSFADYWNNVKNLVPGGPGNIGRIPYGDKVATFSGATTTVPVQTGCTNSPPVSILYPEVIPVETADILRYDIIFDYGDDGFYDVGVDWIDVVAHRNDGGLVPVSEILKLADSEVFGFQIKK